MSSNNNRNRREDEHYWRSLDQKRRQELDTKKKAEDNKKNIVEKRDEKNFPSLGSGARAARPMNPITAGFAARAREAQQKEEEQNMIDADRRRTIALAEAKQKRDAERDEFVWHERRRERYDNDVDYEEDEQPYVPHSKVDAEGWQEVEHKHFKPKRELTSDEMDALYADECDEDEERFDHNEHLLEVSHRHDHR